MQCSMTSDYVALAPAVTHGVAVDSETTWKNKSRSVARTASHHACGECDASACRGVHRASTSYVLRRTWRTGCSGNGFQLYVFPWRLSLCRICSTHVQSAVCYCDAMRHDRPDSCEPWGVRCRVSTRALCPCAVVGSFVVRFIFLLSALCSLCQPPVVVCRSLLSDIHVFGTGIQSWGPASGFKLKVATRACQETTQQQNSVTSIRE